MLGSSTFWFGVIVGVALVWAYHKFGSGMMRGKSQ